jgi:hypothetical protein
MELYKKGLAFDLDHTIGKDGTYIYFSCAEIADLSDIACRLVKFGHNIDIFGTPEFEACVNFKRFGRLQ